MHRNTMGPTAFKETIAYRNNGLCLNNNNILGTTPGTLRCVSFPKACVIGLPLSDTDRTRRSCDCTGPLDLHSSNKVVNDLRPHTLHIGRLFQVCAIRRTTHPPG